MVVLAALLLVYVIGLALMMAATPVSGATPSSCRSIIHRAHLAGVDEEQPAGIARSAHWGWGAELDARVTADGKVVMVHDDTLARISGGTTRAAVGATSAGAVQAVPLVNGGRVITFWKAVKTAKTAGVSLLVELKRWDGIYGDRWRTVGVPSMADTLTRLDMTDRVYLGMGNADWIRDHYPTLRTYWKTTRGSTTEPTPEFVAARGFALVQLGPGDYDHRPALAAAGVPAGTVNVQTKAQWQAARAAGFDLFQTRKPGAVASWCRADHTTGAPS